MDFDVNSLLASMVVSGVGAVALIYGKRQSRVPHMAVGIVMVVFPYFVPDVLIMLVLGIVLTAALWGAVRLGY